MSQTTKENGIVLTLLGQGTLPPDGPGYHAESKENQNIQITFPHALVVRQGSVVWFCNNLSVDVVIKFDQTTGSPFVDAPMEINVEANSVSYPLVVSASQGSYQYLPVALRYNYPFADPVIIVDQPQGPGPKKKS